MRLFKLIVLLMFVTSLVPTAMVGWASLSRTRELLVRDAQELTQERLKQLRLKAQLALDEPTRGVMRLAALPRFFALGVNEQRSHIVALLEQRPDVRAVTFLGADGGRIEGMQAFAVKEVPPTELALYETKAAALLPASGEPRYSDVYWSKRLEEPMLTVLIPFTDAQGVKRHVAAELRLGALARILENERVGSTGFAYVVDGRGRFVAGPRVLRASLGADLSKRPVVASATTTRFAADSLHVGNYGEGDERVVGGFAGIAGPGWAVVSEQPLELAYRQVSTMRRQIAVALGAALVVAVVLAAIFSRGLTRPLKGFGAAALDIAKGRFGVQVNVKSKNELGELANTFNYMSAQIEAYDHETKRLYESLENGYLETIVALANSIDSKDAYTRGHSQRVGDFSVEIGRELGMTERQLKLLHYGGILHDVGKIGIVESILCKQSRLTDDEMVIMREHPAIGDTIIEAVSFLAAVRPAVRNHHERWDGTGYPDRLKGDQIPLIARIVNCADTFDACTSTRPYQKAMPLPQAMEVMEKLTGAQLDPTVVSALRRVVEKKGINVEGSRTPQKMPAGETNGVAATTTAPAPGATSEAPKGA